MEMKSEDMFRWVGVTEQQCDILTSIYRLQLQRVKTNPKSIIQEYEKTYGKDIQTNNLFTILKKLSEKGLITREEKARYRINLQGIKRSLGDSRVLLEKQLQELDYKTQNIEKYFREAAYESIRPTIKYYDYTVGYEKSADMLENAKAYYLASTFPYIAWTQTMAYGQGVGRYVETMWAQCFRKKRLEIKYITNFEVETLFNRALKIFQDPTKAHNECQTIIKNVQTYLEENPMLDIRYLEHPLGLFINMPISEEPSELFLLIRNENKDVVGHIFIRSPDIALQVKELFLREYENAIPINGPKGGKILRGVRKKLREVYEQV